MKIPRSLRSDPNSGVTRRLFLPITPRPARTAVRTGYPRSHPNLADSFAVHVCKVVDGIITLDQIL